MSIATPSMRGAAGFAAAARGQPARLAVAADAAELDIELAVAAARHGHRRLDGRAIRGVDIGQHGAEVAEVLHRLVGAAARRQHRFRVGSTRVERPHRQSRGVRRQLHALLAGRKRGGRAAPPATLEQQSTNQRRLHPHHRDAGQRELAVLLPESRRPERHHAVRRQVGLGQAPAPGLAPIDMHLHRHELGQHQRRSGRAGQQVGAVLRGKATHLGIAGHAPAQAAGADEGRKGPVHRYRRCRRHQRRGIARKVALALAVGKEARREDQPVVTKPLQPRTQRGDRLDLQELDAQPAFEAAHLRLDALFPIARMFAGSEHDQQMPGLGMPPQSLLDGAGDVMTQRHAAEFGRQGPEGAQGILGHGHVQHRRAREDLFAMARHEDQRLGAADDDERRRPRRVLVVQVAGEGTFVGFATEDRGIEKFAEHRRRDMAALAQAPHQALIELDVRRQQAAVGIDHQHVA
jgi:hypothetical protein